jgi:hypothetical protein
LTGRQPGEPIDVPPRGLAAPLNITEICDTDDLVEALSTRRCARSQAHAEEDPAIRLLQSLIADVDQDAPPLPVARSSSATHGAGRRGARTIVVLGMTTALLITTGVAAAATGGGGGLGSSLLRSAMAAKQVTAPQARAELRNVCRAVIVGWYGAGRGTRNRLAVGRGAPGTDAAVRSGRHADPLSLRSPRDRLAGLRHLRMPPIARLVRLQNQQRDQQQDQQRDQQQDRRQGRERGHARGQEFARPSSLSITPST